MEGRGRVQPMTSKAEIDTSAPFRSVKEAVVLFGERVLGSEVYGRNLKEMQIEPIVGSDELEETKQSLQMALEDSINMATSLFSLQQELQQTKLELQQLKTRESDRDQRRGFWDLDTEDVEFVEEYSTELIEEVVKTMTIDQHQKMEFQKKCVRFANPPTIMAQDIVASNINPTPNADQPVLQRHPSIKKKKMKQIIPFIRGFFTKKSGSSQVGLA